MGKIHADSMHADDSDRTNEAASTDAPSTGADAGDPAELARGSVVGRYVVLSKLGAGAMGIVYAAYDPELDRRVALKLLRPRTSEAPTSHRRLVREAQALARLAHPNVVAVHDAGVHEDVVFVAMELVVGETLRVWLGRGPRSWREVLAKYIRAGRGLAAAHAQGLVHRDFKPDNVMLGDDGRVRVMDFGLAREEADSSSSAAADGDDPRPREAALRFDLTRRGALVGTPAYMAPEQFEAGEIGPAADQFGFCVSLWEGLYGVRPFTADSLVDLVSRVCTGEVAEPPARAVPRWVRLIVERGLRVAPDARWPSMGSLCDALARGEARRRRVVAAIGAVVLVLGGLGAWGFVDLGRRHRAALCEAEATAIDAVWNDESRSRLRDTLLGSGASFAETTFDLAAPSIEDWVAAWRDRYEHLCVASRVEERRASELWDASRGCLEDRRLELEELLDALGSADSLVAAQRTYAAVAGLRSVDECGDDAWLLRHASEYDASSSAVRQQLWRASAVGATGEWDDAVAIAEDVLRREDLDDRTRARVLNVAAKMSTETGEHDRTSRWFGEAFDLALAANDPREAVAAAVGLVMVVGYHQSHHAEAHWWARVARGLLEGAQELEGLQAMYLQTSEGAVLLAEGRNDEAEAKFRAASALGNTLVGASHPFVSRARNNIGNALQRQGRTDEALAEHEAALALRAQALGDDHPDVGTSHNNLGRTLLGAGRLDAAEQHLERALTIASEAFGSRSAMVGKVRSNLALLRRNQQRHAEAQEQAELALAIASEALGEAHTDVADTHTALGTILLVRERFEDAARHFARAKEIRTALLGPKHPELADAASNLGAAYTYAARYEAAAAEYEQALAILGEAGGEDDTRLGLTYVNLGDLELARGRNQAATAAFTRALEILRTTLPPEHPHRKQAEAGLSAASR